VDNCSERLHQLPFDFGEESGVMLIIEQCAYCNQLSHEAMFLCCNDGGHFWITKGIDYETGKVEIFPNRW
jgi:hypothetical protein